MQFNKYDSIDAASRKKTVNYIIESGNSDGIWVLLLKIHGSNYSLWYDGVENKKGKRKSFIEGNFLGDHNFNYDDNIKAMYEYLVQVIPNMEVLTICGEIYGGVYNHPEVNKVNGATKVQKEVYYRPDNDFIVFDIKVDGSLLEHDVVVNLCIDFGFKHVPVLATGKFSDLMKFPVVFEDPLYTHFGLPRIDDNDAEGWVLKPIEPKFFENGERIILKGKNPAFCEKNGNKKGKKPANIMELSDEGNRLKDELLSFLVENRLRNVLSHGEIEKVTQKDFGKLLGLFSKDAFSDFIKDNEDDFNNLPSEDQKIIKRFLNREAGNVIRPVFLDIIDDTF